MVFKRIWVCVAAVLLLITVTGTATVQDLTPKEQLGKNLFFDKISDPVRMSCATCHDPKVGFTGPISGINKHGAVYMGAVTQRFGNRKPPSAAYATLSPVFHYDNEESLFVGGNFWDGRATGEDLGNPAADQARGPFLNPLEHNNPDKQAVCEQVATSNYAFLFEDVWGGHIDCSTEENVTETYDRIALSIAAYENSSEVNQFSSKFDANLTGKVILTAEETEGLELFQGKANCSKCHSIEPGPNSEPPLFTYFTYDNLGIPRNPENPFYDMDKVFLDDGTLINPDGRAWVDPGLGGFLLTRFEWKDNASENMGKHKVPTLRNVDQRPDGNKSSSEFVKAYGHNGYFKSLKIIVHFHNTRDVKYTCPENFTSEEDAMKMNCWPEPEINENVNKDELGDLGLNEEEEDAIVAFLKTLSDGYQ